MLELQGISISFGGVQAVADASFAVRDGETLGLIGPNGAGKTTLINIIAGCIIPTAGSVVWNGENVTGRSPHRLLRSGVARTFQNVATIHGLSVRDLVRLGASLPLSEGSWRSVLSAIRGAPPRDEFARRCDDLLDSLGLSVLADKQFQELPYGMRKVADLARAVAGRPHLLLLDEPVAGLTPFEAQMMADVIMKIRDATGCTIIVVEHKLDFIQSLCDRIVVMAAGGIVFEGSHAAMRSDADVRRVYLGEGAAA